MKKNLDIEILRTIYRENKAFLIPIAVLFATIVLIIFFLIPQVNGYIQNQDQVRIEKDKLLNMQKSLSELSQASSDTLDNEVKLSSLSLPPNKDFASILLAISQASAFSGVSLGDFEFQVGDIGKITASGTSVPSLKITLNLTGDIPAIARFIGEMKKSVPISQITSVKASGNFATVDVVFFYKPFPPTGSSDPEKIRNISSQEKNMVDSIKPPANIDFTGITPPVSGGL